MYCFIVLSRNQDDTKFVRRKRHCGTFAGLWCERHCGSSTSKFCSSRNFARSCLKRYSDVEWNDTMPVNKKKTKTIQKNKQSASFSNNDLAVFRQFVDIMKPMLSGEATNRHNQNDSPDESDSHFSSSSSASSDPRENDPSPTRVTRSTKESPTNDEKLSKNSSSKGRRRFTRSTATSTLTKHTGTTHSSTKRRSSVVNTREKKKSKGTTQSSSVAALAPNTDPPTEIPPTENQVIPIQVDGNLDEEHRHRFNLRAAPKDVDDLQGQQQQAP